MDVDKAACAFEILGIEPTHTVGVFSANRPDILVTDFAAFANRAVPVSIYATSSEEQVEYIVKDARVSILFTGNEEQYNIARKVAAKCHCLKQIITYEKVKLHPDDNHTMTFEDFLKLGAAAGELCRKEVAVRTETARPDDICYHTGKASPVRWTRQSQTPKSVSMASLPFENVGWIPKVIRPRTVFPARISIAYFTESVYI